MKRFFNKFYESTGLITDAGQRSVASQVTSTIVGGALAFALMGTVGIDTTPLVTAAGVAGATVGFAAKDYGSNFVASIALSGQQSLRVGNDITVGLGTMAMRGTVVDWDTRYLYLRHSDNLVCIPNSVVLNSVLQWHSPPRDLLSPGAGHQATAAAPGAAAASPFAGSSASMSTQQREWKAEGSGATGASANKKKDQTIK